MRAILPGSKDFKYSDSPVAKATREKDQRMFILWYAILIGMILFGAAVRMF